MREGWEYKKLGEVCESIDSINWRAVSEQETFTYIDLSAVDRESRSIVGTIKITKEDAPSRAKQIVQTDDILFGTTRPTLKRVCQIIKEYNETICSTGFCVLRPKTNIVIPKWILLQLLANNFYLYIEPLQTGANYPAVSDNIVKKYVIPVPPLSVQQSIVSELDLLSEVIAKQKDELKAYDELAQSIFYDMFGDPVTNEKGWEVKKLGEVCLIERGGSPRPIEQFLTEDDDGVNWIKIGDATEGGMVITSTKQRIRPEGVKKSRFVHKGDFLLSNSMSFGKPYILGVDGCIHDGWLVIQDTQHTFNKIYLYYFLGSPQTYESFKSMAVGGVVNNLNKDIVKKVYVAIPHAKIQQSFAEKIASIERQKDLIRQSIAETETLFNSRMDYYFN